MPNVTPIDDKLVIQHETVTDGVWTTWGQDIDGIQAPDLYDTQAEAEAEVSEFLRDCAEAAKRGDMDTVYQREELRIIPFSQVREMVTADFPDFDPHNPDGTSSSAKPGK